VPDDKNGGCDALYLEESNQTVLEMTALPDHFCICINQGGDTIVYADAFCEVLRENGISCHVDDVPHGNPGYIELREYEKWI
jgi:hypothetical protein